MVADFCWGWPLLLPNTSFREWNKVLVHSPLRLANLRWNWFALTFRCYFQKVPCISKMKNMWMRLSPVSYSKQSRTTLHSMLLSFMWPLTNIFPYFSHLCKIHQAGDSLLFPFFILVVLTVVSSVHFSRSVVSDSLRPHESQHARPPCPSPTPGVHPDSCPLSWWCHPIISSSVIPFSSRLQSFPASGSFQMSQLFASSGQSIGALASASVLPMNIQDWSLLG